MRAVLCLLFAAAAPFAVLAQQPQAVDSEAKSRVETPDAAIQAVNPDPDKPAQDVPQQQQSLQQSSTWGMQRMQVQKPASSTASAVQANGAHSGAAMVEPFAMWSPATKKPDITALLGDHAVKAATAVKLKSLKLRDSMPQPQITIGQTPSFATPRNTAFTHTGSGYLNPQTSTPYADFSSALVFDPLRSFAGKNAAPNKVPRHRPAAQARRNCRAALSPQTKQMCLESQEASQKKKAWLSQ